jgi:hypothetical protein
VAVTVLTAQVEVIQTLNAIIAVKWDTGSETVGLSEPNPDTEIPQHDPDLTASQALAISHETVSETHSPASPVNLQASKKKRVKGDKVPAINLRKK